MSISRSARSRLLTSSILVATLAVLVSGADSCRYSELADALQRSLPTPAWGGIEPDRNPGLRIHIYPEWPDVLAEGTVVEPYQPVGGPGRKLTCGSSEGCLLVFIDTEHLAHFAHRVVIALWEIGSNRFHEPIIAGWWPLVDGRPVFNTVESRERLFLPRMVKPVPVEDPSVHWGRAHWQVLAAPAPPPTPTPSSPSGPSWTPLSLPTPVPEPTQSGSEPLTSSSPCQVWAVLVDGYANKADTFDEDTDGMYAVLLGLGVPEDQIYYLSPHHGAAPCQTEPIGAQCPTAHSEDVCATLSSADPCHPPKDLQQRTSLCNLKHVLTKLLPDRMGDTCEELLLFMSSHGQQELLHLDKDLVCAADLENWLEDIKCERVTVVIEACYSGSFIDVLKSPSANQTKRTIFTSTDKEGKSYQDVDGPTAPTEYIGPEWTPDPNPGDSGSETIWGYIEAFGTSSNAAAAVQEVAFDQAVDYAKKNDVMTINELNHPEPYPTPLPNLPLHSCFDDSGTPDIAVEFSVSPQQGQAPAGATNDPSLAYRCETKQIFLKVTNLTTASQPGALAVATVKLYWAEDPQPDWTSDFFDHQAGSYFDHQIGNTVLVTGIGPGDSRVLQLDWEVGKSFEAGDEIVLVATVDSPQDPLPGTSDKVDVFVAATNNAASTKLNVVNRPTTNGCPVGCASVR